MKIAILEDNPGISDYMTVALEMAGHHVQVFTDAANLLASLLPETTVPSELPYDLITVDLLLPGALGGQEFIRRIRYTYPSHRLPLIIISAAVPSFLGPLRDTFPQIPILQKPFQKKHLFQLLEEMKPGEDQAEQLEPGAI